MPELIFLAIIIILNILVLAVRSLARCANTVRPKEVNYRPRQQSRSGGRLRSGSLLIAPGGSVEVAFLRLFQLPPAVGCCTIVGTAA